MKKLKQEYGDKKGEEIYYKMENKMKNKSLSSIYKKK